MHAIQSFLIVVLSGFVWVTIILGLALAEEKTIYDKEWQVKERIRDGTIYDRDWRCQGIRFAACLTVTTSSTRTI